MILSNWSIAVSYTDIILITLEQSVVVDRLSLLVDIRLTMSLSDVDKSPRELTRELIPV